LDHAVAFLKNRDGLDKSLKLMRYAAMLGSFATDPRGVTGMKLRDLDQSTGVARKFLRLGKFLGNASDLRKHLKTNDELSKTMKSACDDAKNQQSSGTVAKKVAKIESEDLDTLERKKRTNRELARLNGLAIGCSSASLVYYFLEHFVWARKVGLIRSRKTKERIDRVSSFSELAVYAFSLRIAWTEVEEARAENERATGALRDHLRKKKEAADADRETDSRDDEDEDEDEVSSDFSRLGVRRSLAADAERSTVSFRSSQTGSPLKNASRRAVLFLKRISRFEGFAAKALSEEDLTENVKSSRKRLTLAVSIFAADLADCAACLGECYGGDPKKNHLRRPGVVGVLGLISALCGVYEKWEGSALGKK
jgi:hypothetical protein